MSKFAATPRDHEADFRKQSSRVSARPDQTNVLQHVSKLAKRNTKSTKASVPSTSSRPLDSRTPSLISGSSTSTVDSPRSTLRRKPSSAISSHAASRHMASSNGERSRSHTAFDHADSKDDYDDSVLGIAVPQGYSHLHHETHKLGDEQCRHHQLSPDLALLSTPSALSATPSTRYTDSPWSHVLTPSSASPYSPAPQSSRGLAWSPPPGEFHDAWTTAGASRLPEDANTPVNERLNCNRESSTSSSDSTLHPAERDPAMSAIGARSVQQSQPKAQMSSTHSNATKTTRRKRLTKEVPTTSLTKRTAQVPPELAHLNVEPVPGPSLQKPGPSLRPSRSGVPNIAGASKPKLVVQSDLPILYTSYHRRTPSSETPVSAASPPPKHRFGFGSRSSSRNQSPRIDSAISSPPIGNQVEGRACSQTGDARRQRKDSPAVGPSPSPAKSPRFGFFTRKPKTVEDTVEKPKRPSRPGPAAGTGHEGYARFGVRGRGSSSTGNMGFRSPSADSTQSTASQSTRGGQAERSSRDGPQMDDFLRSHQQPIYLRGSGSSFGTASTPSDAARASLELQATSSCSTYTAEHPAVSLLPSAMNSCNSVAAHRPLVSGMMIAENSDDGLASHDHELSPSETHIGKVSKKWNFFQRSLASPYSRVKGGSASHSTTGPVASSVTTHQPVAHYTLIDHVQPFDLDEVARLVQDHEPSHDETASIPGGRSKIVPYERRHSTLLPSPLEAVARCEIRNSSTVEQKDPSGPLYPLQPESTHKDRVAHVANLQRPQENKARNCKEVNGRHWQTPNRSTDSLRQPRLSPVGRIPAVVSRRDRDRKLSDASFSRPFVRSQPRHSVRPPGALYSQFRDMAGPIESASQPAFNESARSDEDVGRSSTLTNTSKQSTGRTSTDRYTDCCHSPARKGSGQSGLSSSSSVLQSANVPQQEDVWNEYNDFMDDVTQDRMPLASCAPLRLASILPALSAQPPNMALPALPLTVPQQISRFLQPSLSPLTPDTISGWINGYGNRSTSTLFTDRLSGIDCYEEANAPARHSAAAEHLKAATVPEAHYSDGEADTAAGLQVDREFRAGIDEKAAVLPARASASMREAALKTSKWLSFGRVLFSTAHEQVQRAESSRLLVVDGLNSDWSYYVAMSYPRAEVYNVGPAETDCWPSADGKPPSNHRQISMPGSGLFPFPKGFFDVVVLRYPTMTTEASYASCVAECRRVLRPAGYLEVAVLDLDLMKMGNIARKAVRGLKTRLQLKDKSVCLSNLSDILVRQIGRSAFENVQRCVVGVPVAGKIQRSEDISRTSSSNSDSSQETTRNVSKTFSFNDLVGQAQRDLSPSEQTNDEGITKMVARVGCWWYTNCYENPVLPEELSIWTDRALLRECQREGTSFRLLICHAQKPSQGRRRTVSV